MKKLIIIIFFLAHTLVIFSQKKFAYNWVFDTKGGGVHFKNGSAEIIGDTLKYGYYLKPYPSSYYQEGCASISDPISGELLFFTNGVNIWSRDREVMPNGKGLGIWSFSSSNGVLILPLPGSDSIYYVFSTPSAEDSINTGLRYSVVDMKLNNGLGDVVVGLKNITLVRPVVEKLCGIRHSNKMDYWLVSHKWGNDEFYVFLLTKNGIVDTIINKIGSLHYSNKYDSSDIKRGVMKSNTNGNRIGLCIKGNFLIELFDFDNSTGILSNPMSIPLDSLRYPPNMWPGLPPYGLSFSPNSSKLYFGSAAGGTALYQFDLSVYDVDSIFNSVYAIDTFYASYQSQLAPDGKIYINSQRSLDSLHWGVFLNTIEQPDSLGAKCIYIKDKIFLKDARMGLPNFVESWMIEDSVPVGVVEKNDCNGNIKKCPDSNDLDIVFYPNPVHENLQITITLKENSAIKIFLYNIQGERVKELETKRLEKQSQYNLELNTKDLPNGVYVLKAESEKGSVFRKVVKIK